MMWILSVIQSQIGATNPDPKLPFKESFSRKHVRRKYKRKPFLNSEEKDDLTCNSLNEAEDDESSETEKRCEAKGKTRSHKNILKFTRFVFDAHFTFNTFKQPSSGFQVKLNSTYLSDFTYFDFSIGFSTF